MPRKEVPLNNYLPLTILLKMADPYLILKLYQTNIEARNLIVNNSKFIEKSPKI